MAIFIPPRPCGATVVDVKESKPMNRYPTYISRILLVCLGVMLLCSQGIAQTTEPTPPPRDLEFVPLYKLTQDEAINQLYANLALVGVTKEQIIITTLVSVPNRLVLQGPTDLIAMVKEILATIDPPPAPPAQTPAEVIDSIKIRNISPSEFATKLDEIMNNFIGMVRMQPSAENFIIYARNSSGAGQITFYIPNLDAVRESFNIQPQGYQGYVVYIRATTNESQLISSAKLLIATIDQPNIARIFKSINLYYVQIDEAISSLKSAGYLAVNTTTGSDPAVVTALQAGQGPIIYAAPQVKITSNELSSSPSEGSQSQGGITGNQFNVLTFGNPIATTDIHKLIVLGTPSEIASVERYLALIDVPARQVLIEAQVIELNVDDLTDLGLRKVAGLDDIVSGNVTPVFPGENSATSSGNFFTYDDSASPAGSFNAELAALILNGRATIQARPKVVTVDGRQAIITIGRQVPVVQETQTGDQRSTFNINFVPVGITLNIKPRIGRGGKEVQMQVDAVVSNVETLNNVVSELSLVAPQLNTREVSTIVRIPNHQSLILGGLISTEEETRTYKIPILGDLPFIGNLFKRNREIKDRTEIIIVLTPHVAEEEEPRQDFGDANQYQISDPYFIPLGTDVLDNLDNVLFPGEYLLKQIDLKGIDSATGLPSTPEDEIVPYSANDPVMLTLLQVIRRLKLVDNLKMMAGIELPKDMDMVTAQYHAEAFLIAYLRHLNSLRPSDMVAGRRLLVPSFPIPEEGFAQPQLAWHTINYLATTRANPMLTSLAETIRWLDQQPENQPLTLFQIPEENQKIETTPSVVEPESPDSTTGSGDSGSDETGGSDSGPSGSGETGKS
jgi:type II secretory pathway component GspD/PulD (secretin)